MGATLTLLINLNNNDVPLQFLILLCFSYFLATIFLFQVTASAWLNDLKNQIEHTRILSTVYRSASALGSRLPSIASARAKVAGAGAILRPVSNGTQVISYMQCNCI